MFFLFNPLTVRNEAAHLRSGPREDEILVSPRNGQGCSLSFCSRNDYKSLFGNHTGIDFLWSNFILRQKRYRHFHQTTSTFSRSFIHAPQKIKTPQYQFKFASFRNYLPFSRCRGADDNRRGKWKRCGEFKFCWSGLLSFRTNALDKGMDSLLSLAIGWIRRLIEVYNPGGQPD